MLSLSNKAVENSQNTNHSLSEPMRESESADSFPDMRPETIAQRKLKALAQNSAPVQQMKTLQALAKNYTQTLQAKKSAQATPASQPPVEAPVPAQPYVVQRELKFTDTNETFTEMIPFLMKYGLGDVGKGVQEKLVAITNLVTEGKHSYANIDVLLEELGYVKPPEESSFTVSMVMGTIGDIGVEVTNDTVLTGIKSSKQSTHALYEIELDGKNLMLKQEPEGKSEFMGMKEMDAQGIRVPGTVWVMVSTLGECILMEYLPTLGGGLGTMNAISEDKMAAPAKALGKMHTTDIKIGNVDRLPWRGNGYSGHLNNVFTDLLTREIIGLDSEHHLTIKDDFLDSIKTELKEIKADASTYAAKIFALLIKEGNKDKLNISEEVALVFKTNFAEGLTEALPEDIDALYASNTEADLESLEEI